MKGADFPSKDALMALIQPQLILNREQRGEAEFHIDGAATLYHLCPVVCSLYQIEFLVLAVETRTAC